MPRRVLIWRTGVKRVYLIPGACAPRPDEAERYAATSPKVASEGVLRYQRTTAFSHPRTKTSCRRASQLKSERPPTAGTLIWPKERRAVLRFPTRLYRKGKT